MKWSALNDRIPYRGEIRSIYFAKMRNSNKLSPITNLRSYVIQKSGRLENDNEERYIEVFRIKMLPPDGFHD